jgi:hypothetical protein
MERYRLMEWLNFVSSEIHKQFAPLFNAKITVEWKANQLDRLGRRFDYLTERLNGQSYLMGGHVTVVGLPQEVLPGSGSSGLRAHPAVQASGGRTALRRSFRCVMSIGGLDGLATSGAERCRKWGAPRSAHSVAQGMETAQDLVRDVRLIGIGEHILFLGHLQLPGVVFPAPGAMPPVPRRPNRVTRNDGVQDTKPLMKPMNTRRPKGLSGRCRISIFCSRDSSALVSTCSGE